MFYSLHYIPLNWSGVNKINIKRRTILGLIHYDKQNIIEK